jgi:predicted transcriptional regulator
VEGRGRNARFIGIISLHDIKSVKREMWNFTRVGDVVEPVTDKEIVDISMEISDAIKKMGKSGLGHLVIMSGGRLKGIITKSDVMRFIQIRSELH